MKTYHKNKVQTKSQRACEFTNSQRDTKKAAITLEQMFYAKTKGRPEFLIKEARQLFMLKIWEVYKLHLHNKIEFNRSLESIKMRANINLFIRNAFSDAIIFVNGQNRHDVYNKKEYNKVEVFSNEKLNDLEQKKSKSIEDVILDYGFKGEAKNVAVLLMEGYNEGEILNKLNITQYKFRQIKEKLKKIIKESNE